MKTTSVSGLVGLGLFVLAAGSAGRLQAGIYSDVVLSDNPYAYWEMGELVGTTALDASPIGGSQNGNYGQFSPSDGLPTLGVPGIPGTGGSTAVEFHGTNPVSQLYVADPVSPAAYTIEAWIKADAGATTGRNIIVRTNGDPVGAYADSLRINNDGLLENFTYDGAARYVWDTTPVQPDQWYHVVGLARQGHMELYVNGVQKAAADWGGGGDLWTGGNQWRIAAISGDGTFRQSPSNILDWFDGTIDEVAIYHTELSPEAILRHYQAGIAAITPLRQLHPGPSSVSLDLADVVGGGNGTGTGTPDAGINPGTGALIAAGTPNPGTVTGPGYHTVPLAFVDGVFIPGVNSAGMQVDSTGTTVAYPDRDGQSWGYFRDGPTGGVSSVLDGIDYNTPGHSLIGAHANKGITFDLDAIRAANPGLEIGQFTTVFGKVTPLGGNVDVNVYLDGRLMYGVGGTLTTGTPLQVGISENDRFLTLVASDGGDTYSNDQVIFGDPNLELRQNIALGKPATAWAYYTGANGFPASNLTDGDLNDQYPGDAEGRSFWLAPNGQTGDVVVDLEDLYRIDRVDLQNTHNGPYNDRGVQDFTLLVSEDGQTWTEVTNGTLTQFASSGAHQNIPVETFTFDRIWARYVKVQVDSFYGASAGLNEIRVFQVIPEPSTLVLLGLGLVGLAACGWRRKRS